MAHYAFLDENNIVTEVIPGKDETEIIEGLTPEQWYGNFRGQKCLRTSYHASTNGFRKNYAGIGYFYDEAKDAFIAPQPFPSWNLNDACQWNSPIPYPNDGKYYQWNESALSWDEIS